MKYPKEVPILTAKDMCKCVYARADGSRMCLRGWFSSVFDGWDWRKSIKRCSAQRRGALASLTDVAMVVSGKRIANIENINDNVSAAKAAKIWNEFVKSLGYTEIDYQ